MKITASQKFQLSLSESGPRGPDSAGVRTRLGGHFLGGPNPHVKYLKFKKHTILQHLHYLKGEIKAVAKN